MQVDDENQEDPARDILLEQLQTDPYGVDPLLPSQVRRRYADPMQSRRDLWTAILLRAIADYRMLCLGRPTLALTDGYVVSREPRMAAALLELRAWFESDDETWPGFFVPVCYACNLEPSKVRQLVLEHPLAKLPRFRAESTRVGGQNAPDRLGTRRLLTAS